MIDVRVETYPLRTLSFMFPHQFSVFEEVLMFHLWTVLVSFALLVWWVASLGFPHIPLDFDSLSIKYDVGWHS